MTTTLGRLVEVNPATPGFDSVHEDEDVTFVPLEAVWPDGRADWSRRTIKSAVSSGYTRFDDGDILLPKITPTFEAGRVARSGLSTLAGAATTEVHVLRAKNGVDPTYVTYVCRSQPFLQEGGATLQGVGNLRRVPTDFIRQFPVEITGVEEQRAIADFLDEQTSRIDTLIDKQTQLIATLRERRYGVIASVLSRGIESAEQLGPSKLDWLKTVPARWSPMQVKHFGTLTLGKMLQSADSGGDVLATYMRAANVQPDGQLRLSDQKEMWFAASELQGLTIKTGDVVVVEGGVGGFGRAAHVSKDLDGWGFQNSIIRIRPNGGNDGRFLTYVLLLARASGYVRAYCNVVSMPHFTSDKVASFRFACPSPKEQRQIADHLDEQTAKIDTLITKTEEHIALAKERRSALITAAVTGQIDVRTAERAGKVDI